jgi:hypothetical protein
MNADWDILVILDGCRFDLFEKESTLEGNTKKITSSASDSQEFMAAHFRGNSHFDTVYVSANPFTHQLEENIFYDVKNVYSTHWDETLETVPPESVANVGCNVANKCPNKRIIVHFMQPHYPFIGELGRSFHSGDLDGGGNDIWTQLQNHRCTLEKETVWDAYAENYRITEPPVRRLQSDTDGKMVVTSDHGNLFGERLSPIPVKCYGHPPGVRHSKLNTVPWHELPTDGRREITSDSPKSDKSNSMTDLEEKLSALGYN